MPIGEPLPDLPSAFRDAVHRARIARRDLLVLSRADLTAWVAQNPAELMTVGDDGPFVASSGQCLSVFGAITGDGICHGRDDIKPFRVASILHGLLHNATVDEFGRGVLMPLTDPSWTRALTVRGLASTHRLFRARWFVASGNHRIRAQQLLGLTPALQRVDPPTWT